MPPTKNKSGLSIPKTPIMGKLWQKFMNRDYLKRIVFDPHLLLPSCCVLFIFELVLNVFIIEKVSYTEIDWKAYMQEVEGFLNGTWDYKDLRGDTGPLVYPAGFVYIYGVLYKLTNRGWNIYLAQYIFLVLYLVQLLLTYRVYFKTAKIPPYALVLSTLTSYRIHSIFVLRLFNDPVAVLLFYISLNLFISNKWVLGSFFYSLAVSVKMNILLYAPCLLITYLTNLTLTETIINLAICGFVQLVLGLPFLLTNYHSYLMGSFDLGRIFEHKWTVNYRFLSIEVFESRILHISLLLLHIILLLIFTPLLRRFLSSYAKLTVVRREIETQINEEVRKKLKDNAKLNNKEKEFIEKFEQQLLANRQEGYSEQERLKLKDKMNKTSQLLVLPFFVTNLIGIACARSLHYQFYSWYFHSLLYLTFCTGFQKPLAFLLLAAIEYCWNVYPSTDFSSALLHACHLLLLLGVYKTMKI